MAKKKKKIESESPLERYDTQEIREHLGFIILHLKRGLAHIDPRTYAKQNAARNFTMELDHYIALKAKEAKDENETGGKNGRING